MNWCDNVVLDCTVDQILADPILMNQCYDHWSWAFWRPF